MSSVGGDDVLVAVLAVLRGRLPAVIDGMNARAALGGGQLLESIRDWRVVADFDARTDGQLPQLSVDTPGYVREPGQRVVAGGGSLTWPVVITVLHRSQGAAETLLRTQRYVTAASDALLASSPIDVAGRWCDVVPVAAAYDEVEPSQRRTLGAGFVEVNVTVPNAIDLTSVPPVSEPVPIADMNVTVNRRPL
jgi:hypothetical protein